MRLLAVSGGDERKKKGHVAVKVFGIAVVRDEADILALTLAHHFRLGFDKILVIDHESEDGTTEILHEVARGGRLSWRTHRGAYHQSALLTHLARQAAASGADWIVPFDADEFWYAPGGDFRKVLEESNGGALKAEVVNFVQRREQLAKSSDALMRMTARVEIPVGPFDRVVELVESRRVAYVEMEYPPKWISRASALLEIGWGNHEVGGFEGLPAPACPIVCLHAPLRAFAVLQAKIGTGLSEPEIRDQPGISWHLRRWRRISGEGLLEQEWRANSVEDGMLDVYGHSRPLVTDTTLRDLVVPLLREEVFLSTAKLPDPLRGEIEAVLALISDIPGWFGEDETRLLMRVAAAAASEFPGQSCVEIGSYCGRSTIVLARAVKSAGLGSAVFAIDPHEGLVGACDSAVGLSKLDPTYEAFLKNILGAGVQHVVVPLRQKSTEVHWNRPISLLFIDGLHDYVSVRDDFLHFERFVSADGYVAFDDYHSDFPGVVVAVDEILRSGEYILETRSGRLAVLRKAGGSPNAPTTPAGPEGATTPGVGDGSGAEAVKSTHLHDQLRQETSKDVSESSGAERYERDSGSTHVIRMVGENHRVLAIGRSTGHMARMLVARRNRVTAVEIDPAAPPQAAGSSESLAVGDIEDPDVIAGLEGKFDVILADDVLEHLKYPERTLRTLRPLLRVGGFIVASHSSVANEDSRPALCGSVPHADKGFLDRTHPRPLTENTVREFLEAGDFGIVEIERVEADPAGPRPEFAPPVLTEESLRILGSNRGRRTYQFVVKAVPLSTEVERVLHARLRRLEDDIQRLARETIDAAAPSLRAELQSTRNHVAIRDHTISVLRQQVHAYKAGADERDQTISALRAEVEAHQRQARELLESLRAHQEQSSTHAHAVAAYEREIALLSDELGVQNIRNRDLVTARRDHVQSLDKMRGEATLQEPAIEQIRDGMESLRRSAKSNVDAAAVLHRQVSERDEAIELLRRELPSQCARSDAGEALIQQQEQSLLALRAWAASESAAIADRDRVIHELEDKLTRIRLSIPGRLYALLKRTLGR